MDDRINIHDPEHVPLFILVRSHATGQPIGFVSASRRASVDGGPRVYGLAASEDDAMAFGSLPRALAFALAVKDQFPDTDLVAVSPARPIPTNPVEFN
jgi:hypothetical protein